MYVMDGQPISPDVPFEKDGVQYPAGWMTLATPEELEAVGITVVLDPPQQPPFDYRFYYSAGVPRPVEDIQKMYLGEIKARAQQEIYRKYPAWRQENVTSRGVELAYVDRALTTEEAAEVEKFKLVWDDIKALRAHSNALEAEMLALPFEQLTTWQQHGWPEPEVP